MSAPHPAGSAPRRMVLPAAVALLLAALCTAMLGDPGSWSPAFLLAGGLGLLAAEIAMSWSSVSLAIFQRSTLYSLNSALQVLVVLALLGLVNHLAWRRSERVWWMPKLDWSELGVHTFSKQTEEVLARLARRQKPVKVTAFFLDPKGQSQQERMLRAQRGEVTGLLERYAQRCPKFEYRLVDPEVDPLEAQRYGVKVPGLVVIETEERKLEVVASDLFSGNPMFGQKRRFKGEQVLTSKLLDILEGTKRTLYFLTGHQEADLEKDGPEGLSLLRQGLEADNIRLQKLNLLLVDDVPDDCSVLVLAGGNQDLAEHEVEAIRRYLERKRPMLVLVDSHPFRKRVAALLAELGVALRPNLVIEPDPQHHLAGRPVVPVPDLNGHAITNPLIEDGLRVVFNEATALDQGALAGERYDVRTILQSSPEAWGETSFGAAAAQGVRRDPEDVQPTFAMAMAISSRLTSNDGEHLRPESELRVVVHGDSDYIDNSNLSYPGNFDFFANSVRWLTRDMDRITIRPKEFTERRADIPKGLEGRLFLGLTFGLPGVFLALAFTVWWQRRAM